MRAEPPVSLGQTLLAGAPAHVLTPSRAARAARVLVLHGYGQSRHEALAMGISLAEHGYSALVPDLPGHGSHPATLSAGAALGFVADAVSELRTYGDGVGAVGFSLGARLALASGADSVVAVSPPGAAHFDGDVHAVTRELRPHNVREASPLAGLTEILTRLGTDWRAIGPTRVVYGRSDLASVRDYIKHAPDGISVVKVPFADHHGTWWASRTREAVVEWLLTHLGTGEATSG